MPPPAAVATSNKQARETGEAPAARPQSSPNRADAEPLVIHDRVCLTYRSPHVQSQPNRPERAPGPGSRSLSPPQLWRATIARPRRRVDAGRRRDSKYPLSLPSRRRNSAVVPGTPVFAIALSLYAQTPGLVCAVFACALTVLTCVDGLPATSGGGSRCRRSTRPSTRS
jgi:hypothetical protein